MRFVSAFAVVTLGLGLAACNSMDASDQMGQHVWKALPIGTVLFFDTPLPNPAPDGWERCPADGSLVRIQQGAPGTSYAGQDATIRGTTDGPGPNAASY